MYPVGMLLSEQSWPELGDYVSAESLAVIPIGSTEQHGPHLPLATDYLIAEALAREATERTGHVCTPTLQIGVSPHHKQFHGTMWVDAPAFRSFVESFSRNLTYHGIDRIVYVNAHGGNVEPLREVGRRLRDDDVAYAVEWMWNESISDLVDELFERPGPHGGPKETAMIMHIAPDLVRTDRLTDARDGGMPAWEGGNVVHGARTFYDAIDNTPNGVLGDQTNASPEAGERLFSAATDQLVALLEWMDEGRIKELKPKQHVKPRPGSHR